MIQKLLISIIIILLTSSSVNALEVISGTVIFVDRHLGRMEIRMDSNEPLPPHRFHPPLPPPVAVVYFLPDRLPPCVSAGNVVYVWGVPDLVKPLLFRAHFIRGGWAGHDPTGVRRRIERHERRERHHDPDRRFRHDDCPFDRRGCRPRP